MSKYEPDTEAKSESTRWNITIQLEHKGQTFTADPIHIAHSQIINLGYLTQGRANELTQKWMHK